jgi:hypothetical protein
MKNKKRDDTATITASALNVTSSYVRMVIKGTRKSQSPKASRILKHYKNILEAKHQLSNPGKSGNKNAN